VIAPASILIEKNTALAEVLLLKNGSGANAWMPFPNYLDRQQLEKKLTTAGWSFLFTWPARSGRLPSFLRGKGFVNQALKPIVASLHLRAK
jgi:hypothetical protein